MKNLIRLLTAPITVIVWLCAGLLYVSSFLFGLAGAALSVLALVVILAGNKRHIISFDQIAVSSSTAFSPCSIIR